MTTDGWRSASLRLGALVGLILALTLAPAAASAGDDAAFVSYADVPSKIGKSGTAMVTVTMMNTGTTTWETTVESEATDEGLKVTTTTYSLDALDNRWGAGSVPVDGSVAPGATHGFRFRITAPARAGSYSFRWRMLRTTEVRINERPVAAGAGSTSFGATTPMQVIGVGTAPQFSGGVPNQHWFKGMAMPP